MGNAAGTQGDAQPQQLQSEAKDHQLIEKKEELVAETGQRPQTAWEPIKQWKLRDGWSRVPLLFTPPYTSPLILWWNQGMFFSITPMSEDDVPVRVLQNTIGGDISLYQTMYRADKGPEDKKVLVQVSKVAYIPMVANTPIIGGQMAHVLVRGAIVPGVEFVESGIKVSDDMQKRKRDAEIVNADLYVSELQQQELQKQMRPLMDRLKKGQDGWHSVAVIAKPENVKHIDYFYWDQESEFLTKRVTTGNDIPIIVWYHPDVGVWPQQTLYKIKSTTQCWVLLAVKPIAEKGPKGEDVVTKIQMRFGLGKENIRTVLASRSKENIVAQRTEDIGRIISSTTEVSLEE